MGEITVNGLRLNGTVSGCRQARMDPEIAGAISDIDVEDLIRYIELSHFHLNVSVQKTLRALLCLL